MQIVDLEIELVDLPYKVTRKLTVPATIALNDLHKVLQAAMGWDNSHMFDFTCGTGRKAHRWFKIDPVCRSARRREFANTIEEVCART